MHNATINKLENELAHAQDEVKKLEAQIHPHVFFTLGSTTDASDQSSTTLFTETTESISTHTKDSSVSSTSADTDAVFSILHRKQNAFHSQTLHEKHLQKLNDEHSQTIERLNEHLAARDETVLF